MIETVSWALLGCFAGIGTGLTPGIHNNTVSAFAVTLVASGNINLAVFITAMAVVHSFADFIPSLFLGIPSEDTFISLLPGQKFFAHGKGFHALKLTIFGGVFGTVAAMTGLPVFYLFVVRFSSALYIIIPAVLLAVAAVMFLSEKGTARFWGAMVFIVSGILGVIVLSYGGMTDSLFPAITGLFGAPMLVSSLFKKNRFRRQEIKTESHGKRTVVRGSMLSAVAGAMVSLFPGIGPSEAAFMLRKLAGKISSSEYLVVLGGVNTVNMIFSFFVLFVLGKTRTGAAAAVSQLIDLSPDNLWIIISAVLLASGFAVIATESVGKAVINNIQRVGSNTLNAASLAVVCLLVFLLSGGTGLFVLAVSTAIGMIPLYAGVRRTHAMGFLMVPSLLYYLTLLNLF